jgi:hypothetical protein
MKTIILLFLLVTAGAVKAQTLKEALYGGRLKADTGSLVKKGDSLKLREMPVKKANTDTMAVAVDPARPAEPVVNEAPVTPAAAAATAVKDNNKIWKQFVEEYSNIIRSEVLPSKKIKNGTYSILIDYEIGLDGSVSTINVDCTPQNSYLVEQVKIRMMYNAPQLNPVLLSNGKPRKALKKQMLTFVKEK